MSILPSIKTRVIRLDVKANQPFVVEHNMGREVEGWLIVDVTAPVKVWRSGTSTKEILELCADKACSLALVLL